MDENSSSKTSSYTIALLRIAVIMVALFGFVVIKNSDSLWGRINGIETPKSNENVESLNALAASRPLPLASDHQKTSDHVQASGQDDTESLPPQLDEVEPVDYHIRPQHRAIILQRDNACSRPSTGIIDEEDQLPLADYYELTIVADDLPADFTSVLRTRLDALIQAYLTLLGHNNMSRVSLHLTIHTNPASYQRHAQNLGAEAANTRGLYSHKYARAIIFAQSPEQGMRTAIHESVHMLNHALVGYLDRWVNEGMAEYFENLFVQDDEYIVGLSHDWTQQGERLFEGEDLLWFLSGDNPDWLSSSPQLQQLYANSWHWVYYLMESPQRRQAFGSLLQTERQSPCTLIAVEQSTEFLNRRAPDFEDNFSLWQSEPLSEHLWIHEQPSNLSPESEP